MAQAPRPRARRLGRRPAPSPAARRSDPDGAERRRADRAQRPGDQPGDRCVSRRPRCSPRPRWAGATAPSRRRRSSAPSRTLERQLASPSGDTRTAPPTRRAPRRRLIAPSLRTKAGAGHDHLLSCLQRTTRREMGSRPIGSSRTDQPDLRHARRDHRRAGRGHARPHEARDPGGAQAERPRAATRDPASSSTTRSAAATRAQGVAAPSQASGTHMARGRGRSGAPNGIRIRAAGLKGRCPRPLDDGGTRCAAGGLYLRRGGSRGIRPVPRRESARVALAPRRPSPCASVLHQCLRCVTPARAALSGAAPRGVARASPSVLAASPIRRQAFPRRRHRPHLPCAP